MHTHTPADTHAHAHTDAHTRAHTHEHTRMHIHTHAHTHKHKTHARNTYAAPVRPPTRVEAPIPRGRAPWAGRVQAGAA